jgi:hypothetical protein
VQIREAVELAARQYRSLAEPPDAGR